MVTKTGTDAAITPACVDVVSISAFCFKKEIEAGLKEDQGQQIFPVALPVPPSAEASVERVQLRRMRQSACTT